MLHKDSARNIALTLPQLRYSLLMPAIVWEAFFLLHFPLGPPPCTGNVDGQCGKWGCFALVQVYVHPVPAQF